MKTKSFNMDGVGAVASFACAVHCAAIPILIGFGAAGAVSWLDHPPVEWGLVGLAAVVGTVSAWRGYKTHGNAPVAVVLATAAVSLLALTWMSHGVEAAHIGHAGHAHGAHTGEWKWLFPVLGLTVAVSHLVNRKLCASCTSCEAHEHAPVCAATVASSIDDRVR